MPRKPRLPPVHTLEIQPLSGVVGPMELQAPSTFVDDWGQVQEYAPQVVEKATQRLANVRSREQVIAAAQRKHVQAIEDHRKTMDEFIRKRMQPTLRAPVQPGQQAIKLTDSLVITPSALAPAKPWRRL